MKEDTTAKEIAEAIIKTSEGLRLKEYICPAGVKTIGWGHTRPNKITKEEAEALLKSDISMYLTAINALVKVSVTKNMAAALISFVFNVGINAFKKSTLLKRLNEKKYVAAGDEFLRWVYADKKILEGLVKRREKRDYCFYHQVLLERKMMNPKLAYPNEPEYFRKVYKRFKHGEYVYAFEATFGEMKAVGRLKKRNPGLINRYHIVSDEQDPEYIKGFGLNKIKKNEIVYFGEPQCEKYFPNTYDADEEESDRLRIAPRVMYLRKDGYLLNPKKMLDICEKHGWESLPILYEGKYNPDYVINLNHGPSRYNQAIQRAGVLMITDSGKTAFLPNQYEVGESGFKQWIRAGGYRR